MSTNGIDGLMVETRNYGATAAFWAALGFEKVIETDHGSGQWRHPAGGPYIFIVEHQEQRDLETHVILAVPDAATFAPARQLDYAQPFTAQHWGVLQAIVRDPDGRSVSLEAPDRDASHSHG